MFVDDGGSMLIVVELLLCQLSFIARLMCPLGWFGPGGVLPGPSVTQGATTFAFTVTTKLLGQVFLWHLGEELVEVARTEDVDLLHGDRIEERLDKTEGAAESPRSIDDVQFA